MVVRVQEGIAAHQQVRADQVSLARLPHPGTFAHDLVDRVDGDLNGDHADDFAVLADRCGDELGGGVARGGVRTRVGDGNLALLGRYAPYVAQRRVDLVGPLAEVGLFGHGEGGVALVGTHQEDVVKAVLLHEAFEGIEVLVVDRDVLVGRVVALVGMAEELPAAGPAPGVERLVEPPDRLVYEGVVGQRAAVTDPVLEEPFDLVPLDFAHRREFPEGLLAERGDRFGEYAHVASAFAEVLFDLAFLHVAQGDQLIERLLLQRLGGFGFGVLQRVVRAAVGEPRANGQR